jgi:hypothetical protein
MSVQPWTHSDWTMDSGHWFELHEAGIINWPESPGSGWIINFSQKLLFLLSVENSISRLNCASLLVETFNKVFFTFSPGFVPIASLPQRQCYVLVEQVRWVNFWGNYVKRFRLGSLDWFTWSCCGAAASRLRARTCATVWNYHQLLRFLCLFVICIVNCLLRSIGLNSQ